MSHVCRTCLCEITDQNFFNVSDGSTIENQLAYCIPEVVPRIVVDPIMCKSCATLLDAMYNFKHRCLQSEERIRRNIKNDKPASNNFNLVKLCYCYKEDDGTTLRSIRFIVNECVPSEQQPNIKQELKEQSKPFEIGYVNEYETKDCIKIEEHELKPFDKFVGIEMPVPQVEGSIETDCKLELDKFSPSSSAMVDFNGKRELKEEVSSMETKLESNSVEIIYNIEQKPSVHSFPDQSNLLNKERVRQIFSRRKRNGGQKFKEPFKCNICPYTTTVKINLKRHLLAHSGEKHFQCQKCDFKSAIKSRLKDHMKKHGEEKPFQCDKCDYKSVRACNLKVHLKKHNKKMPYQCYVCDYGTVVKKDLERHLMIHTGEKPYSCNECDFKCIRKENLDNHIKVKHIREMSFACEICQYKTPSKACFRNHMILHSEGKQFECHECGFRFINAYRLKEHMKRHDNERFFQCDKCDYKSVRVINFRAHMRKHNNEMPFRCSNCEYATANKKHMERHAMTHTGETPFSCSKCDYRASQDVNLKKHMETHAQCGVCNYETTRTLMKTHMLSHTEKVAG